MAWARLHVTTELTDCQIGAMGDKVQAFGDFVGTHGSTKFPIDGERAGCSGNIHFAAAPPDFYVALGVGNFNVAPFRVNADVTSRVPNLDVTFCCTDDYRLVHVGDGHVAPLVSNRERSLFGNGNVHVQTDARVTPARVDGPN